MANLSNINGKFVVEQTTGYVGVGTTDPNYPIEVLNAAAEIALNASGASIYRLRSDSTDSFRINKNGVGDRLIIAGNGDATFAGNVNILTAGYPLIDLGVSGTNYFRFIHDNPNDILKIGKNGAATASSVIINPSGDVGIGTASFGHFTNTKELLIEGDVTNTNSVLQVISYDNLSSLTIYAGAYSTDDPAIIYQNDLRFGSTNDVGLGGYSEKMRITNGGNVGIGTDSPAVKLHIKDTSQNGSITDTIPTWWGQVIERSYTAASNAALGVIGGTTAAGAGGFLYLGFSDDVDANSIGINNNPAAGTMVFQVNNSPRMVIQPAGNVGIGTTSPDVPLDVEGAIQASESGGDFIRMQTDGTNNIFDVNSGDYVFRTSGFTERMRITSTGAISVGSSGTAYGTAGQVLTSNGNASPSWQAAGGGGAWTTTGNDIYNSNSGSVGIKNTSPSSLPADSNQLVVGSGVNTGSHGSANVGITIFTADSTFPYADYARLLFTHSTLSARGYLFEYLNRDNSGYADSEPSLTIIGSGQKFIGITNQTNSTSVPKIVLDTNYFNSSLTQGSLHRAMFTIPVRSGVNNPGMHIYGDSQGNSNPFVGFTSTSSSSSITTKFIRFYHNSTLCGTIQKRFNANEVQYLTTSDYRLKEDLKPFKALDTICKIKVYNYKWNNIEVDNVNYGVLAHELQELIPEVVAGEKDEVNKNGEKEYQSVDYSKLVPHLIQSIQELKADNDSLKARIETLENK